MVDVSGMGQLFGAGRAHAPGPRVSRTTRSPRTSGRHRLPHGPQHPGGDGHRSRASPPRTCRDLARVLGRDRPHPQGAGRVQRREGPRGPISLGAVATIAAAPSPAPSPSPVARRPRAEDDAQAARRPVVAFGDSRLREQRAPRLPGQPGLLPERVAWLAEDPDLISIRPKEPEDQRLFLTPGPAAERGLRGPGPAARALRGPGGRDLVAAAVRVDDRPFWKTYVAWRRWPPASAPTSTSSSEEARARHRTRRRRRRSSPSTRPR